MITAWIDKLGAVLNETPALLREGLAELRRNRAENARWRQADTMRDLGELVAQFVEGKLHATPDHGGPRDPETIEIAAPVAHANRSGLVTDCSQPGSWNTYGDQRAAVEGFATAETVEKLRGLVHGTRLVMQVAEPLSVADQLRGRRYSGSVPVSRWGNGYTATDFGTRITAGEAASMFDGAAGDDLAEAMRVTIYDPQWGPSDLLWQRLGAPDWDNPPPPPRTPEETDMPFWNPFRRREADDVWTVGDEWDRRGADAEHEATRAQWAAAANPPPPRPTGPDTYSGSCGDDDCGWSGTDHDTRAAAQAEQHPHEAGTGHRNWTAGTVPPGMAINNPMTDGTAAHPEVLDVAHVERLGKGTVRVHSVDGASEILSEAWPVAVHTAARADRAATVVADEQDRHAAAPVSPELAAARAELDELDAQRLADYERDPTTWDANRSADPDTHARYTAAVNRVIDMQDAATIGDPPEPPVGTVLETTDDFDGGAVYRIERLADGWAIQYPPGESENGATHTSSRIGWDSAQRAWNAGSATEVPADAPPLPPSPPFGEGTAPPPGWLAAAEPWTPSHRDDMHRAAVDTLLAQGLSLEEAEARVGQSSAAATGDPGPESLDPEPGSAWREVEPAGAQPDGEFTCDDAEGDRFSRRWAQPHPDNDGTTLETTISATAIDNGERRSMLIDTEWRHLDADGEEIDNWGEQDDSVRDGPTNEAWPTAEDVRAEIDAINQPAAWNETPLRGAVPATAEADRAAEIAELYERATARARQGEYGAADTDEGINVGDSDDANQTASPPPLTDSHDRWDEIQAQHQDDMRRAAVDIFMATGLSQEEAEARVDGRPSPADDTEQGPDRDAIAEYELAADAADVTSEQLARLAGQRTREALAEDDPDAARELFDKAVAASESGARYYEAARAAERAGRAADAYPYPEEGSVEYWDRQIEENRAREQDGVLPRSERDLRARRAAAEQAARAPEEPAGPPPTARPWSPGDRHGHVDVPPSGGRTTTTSSTSSSGGSMSSIEEVRGSIMQANSSASGGVGMLSQAHSELEVAQRSLLAATEGSSQADVSEATGMLARALDSVLEAQQAAQGAIQAAENVAARL